MAERNFDARIKQKRDTSANWTQKNPVLLNGEIIVVDTDNGDVRFKIGDGVKTYTQLPFEDEAVRNLINNVDSALTALEVGEVAELRNDVDNKIDAPAVASLSQTIVVDQTDENGKPTAWRTSDISELDSVYVLGENETLDDVPDCAEVVYDMKTAGFGIDIEDIAEIVARLIDTSLLDLIGNGVIA